MKYCSSCGSEVELKVPEEDHLPRYCCVKCKTIHYQNPKIVTGTIPIMREPMPISATLVIISFSTA